MGQRARKIISREEAAYVKLLLEAPNAELKKSGLQRLCKFYRQGYRLTNPQPIITIILGLLYDENSKVCRWALNSLALLRTNGDVRPILDAIKNNRNDPDVLAAGISALAALSDAETVKICLSQADLPLEGMVLLAATQHSDGFQVQLRAAKVDIEIASPSELRLASVLVGLNRAPEHLFSPRFQNRQIIGQLNRHPDDFTAQYSVWAISENPGMSLADLGMKLHDVEARPENVRGYVYQLATANEDTARSNYEFLVAASQDPSVDARQGLATGIRDVYFDSMEKLVFDWIPDEVSDAIRERLFEHMAANVARFSGYEDAALAAYETYSNSPVARARLAAAARGTELYKAMRRVDFDSNAKDLFSVPRHSPTASRSSREAELKKGKDSVEPKVLIVTALPKEGAAVKATFNARKTIGVPADRVIYELGVFRADSPTAVDRQVLLVTSVGMGKANASTIATNALRSFPSIEHILMVGIAGGCPNPDRSDEHVRLGDVVWSNNMGIVEYDFTKQTVGSREIRAFPQKPSAALLTVANHLQSEIILGGKPWEKILAEASAVLGVPYARPLADTDLLHSNRSLVPHPADGARQVGLPRVFGGGIATADTLQKDPTVRDFLRDKYGVRAIEMEASGLQSAAWVDGKDVFVIRGICDYCDEYKTDHWQNYAALAAAAYARALVMAMPSEWF